MLFRSLTKIPTRINPNLVNIPLVNLINIHVVIITMIFTNIPVAILTKILSKIPLVIVAKILTNLPVVISTMIPLVIL